MYPITTNRRMEKGDKIYVAGHTGMVGSAIMRRLQAEGFTNLVYRTSAELDLRRQADVQAFFEAERPQVVVLAAAKVGGILANDTYRADFLYDNLMVEANVIQACHAVEVKKLLFLASSCMYPKLAPQPLKEEYLLTGALEPTNEPYAVAKLAGLKLAETFRHQYGLNAISVIPTNLYGPNDHYDVSHSHVLPALLRKFHEAKQAGAASVSVWGTGTPRREFLHVDDLAEACVFLLQTYNSGAPLNIGTGEDISIRELAEIIQQVVGFEGELVFDATKPDGTPRKLLDVSKIHALGWKAKTGLREGITHVYRQLTQANFSAFAE